MAICPPPCPAPVDTWATAVARFGTMSFSEILQPTIEFAEHGFPVYASMSNRIGLSEDKFNDLYPDNRRDLPQQRDERVVSVRFSATPTSARCSGLCAAPRTRRRVGAGSPASRPPATPSTRAR